MNVLMQMVLECLNNGLYIKLEKHGNDIRAYFTNGFYKSDGDAYMRVDDVDTTSLVLVTRYGSVGYVNSFKDIVLSSYVWYNSSKDRYVGWRNPPEEWHKLYNDFNMYN